MDAYADDSIVFLRKGYGDGQVLAVDRNGLNQRTLDENARSFLVSPNEEWMAVFGSSKGSKKAIDQARFFNLKKGYFYRATLPEADWWDCGWSRDSRAIYVFREKRSSNQAPSSCEALSLEVGAGTATLKKVENFGSEGFFKKMSEFKEKRFFEKQRYASPDGRRILEWKIDKQYERLPHSRIGSLYLIDLENKKKTLVFENDNKDFAEMVSTTGFPWSPDGGRFVLSYKPGGMLKEMWWETAEKLRNLSGKTKSRSRLHVIDPDTLSRKELANGESACWLKNLPEKFEEHPKAIVSDTQ